MVGISVIVPVYNAERYLARCIDSILTQTYNNFELILVDDGSTDCSGKICDKYAKADARIKVVHKENGGVSTARNAGIDIAKGEYITFIDSDDFVEREFFASAYKSVLSHNADEFISGIVMETIGDNDLVVRSDHYTAIKSRVYDARLLLEMLNIDYPLICICGPCCKLYRTDIIKNNSIRFDVLMSLGEDTLFNLQVLKHTDNIYFSKEIFYHYYRGNENSLFSIFRKDTYEIHTCVYDEMRQVMISKNCDHQAMIAFEEMYFDLLISGIHKYYLNWEMTTYDERKEQIRKVISNEFILKLPLSQVKGIKRKIILIFVKLHFNCIIGAMFGLYYRVIKWKKRREQ